MMVSEHTVPNGIFQKKGRWASTHEQGAGDHDDDGAVLGRGLGIKAGNLVLDLGEGEVLFATTVS